MPELTLEQIAEDLSLANEMGTDWGYGIVDGQLTAEHYSEDGTTDYIFTIALAVTKKEQTK